MSYINIDKNYNLISSDEKIVKGKKLHSQFQNFLTNDNIVIVSYEIAKPVNKIVLKVNGENMEFQFILKNITNAGWKDKPNFKRIQIQNIFLKGDTPVSYNYNKLLIIGYYNYDNNPMIVVWNPREMDKHNTLRSCYILTDTMLMGYKKKYYSTIVSGKKVWLLTPGFFNIFIKDYLEYNNKVDNNEK